MNKSEDVPMFVSIYTAALGFYFMNLWAMWLYDPAHIAYKLSINSMDKNLSLFHFKLGMPALMTFFVGLMFIYLAFRDRLFALIGLGAFSLLGGLTFFRCFNVSSLELALVKDRVVSHFALAFVLSIVFFVAGSVGFIKKRNHRKRMAKPNI